MYKKVIKQLKKAEFPKIDPSIDNVKINPEHGAKIAQAYDEMKHDPTNPEVKEAYGALIDETKNQFKDIMDKGLKISRIEPGMENPYKNSKELHADIKNNNHLWYFPTELGYGQNEKETSDNPMLQPTGIKHGDKELLANDMFRIVHDINGHHLGGESGFGPTGEHRAYLTHKQIYSPAAQKALASETMGQNSWVNFGPHGEHNQKNPTQTVYAEQKTGLLPDDIINQDWHTQSDIIKSENFYSNEEFQKILTNFMLKKTAEHPEISTEELKKNFGKLLRNGVILLGLAHAHRYMDTPPVGNVNLTPSDSYEKYQPLPEETETEKDKRFQPTPFSFTRWEKKPKSTPSTKFVTSKETSDFQDESDPGTDQDEFEDEETQTSSSSNSFENVKKSEKLRNFIKKTSPQNLRR